MINYKKAKVDFSEIKNIMNKHNTLNDLIVELEKEKTFNITNDFRDKFIDCNYKSLCVTITEDNNKLNIGNYVEIWDDTGSLDFELKNINEI